jgi:drug/metabolite transporter (DMT)-like permease
MERPTTKNWLFLIALGVIWGSSFMAVSIAIRGFGPLTVAAGRISIGAIVLLVILRTLRIRLPRADSNQGRLIWVAAAGFGFFSMALPFFLLSWGQTYVASGFAGVTMAAVPLLVLPLAHFLIRGDRMTLPKGIGFITGFAGVIVLIGLDAFQSNGLGMEPLARLACFAAAGCYALGSIITRLAPKMDPIAFAATSTLLGALMITPAALALEGIPQSAPGIATLAILFLGLVPTALANLLLVNVIRSAGPSFLSLVNYQVPVWSVVFGTAFLGETLPGRIYFALGLILAGLIISQHRKR